VNLLESILGGVMCWMDEHIPGPWEKPSAALARYNEWEERCWAEAKRRSEAMSPTCLSCQCVGPHQVSQVWQSPGFVVGDFVRTCSTCKHVTLIPFTASERTDIDFTIYKRLNPWHTGATRSGADKVRGTP